MEVGHVPSLVNPVSSGTNLWHFRGALYGADNLLLEHIPVAFQLLCNLQRDFTNTV